MSTNLVLKHEHQWYIGKRHVPMLPSSLLGLSFVFCCTYDTVYKYMQGHPPPSVAKNCSFTAEVPTYYKLIISLFLLCGFQCWGYYIGINIIIKLIYNI